MSKIIGIVLAGGQGKRMNSNISKQYIIIEDKPILYYSLKTFEDEKDIDEVILVVGDGETKYCKEDIVDKYNFTKVKKIVVGGKERYNSVYNGLLAIENDDSYVLIHDGARPLLSKDLLLRMIKSVYEYKACVAAVLVKDTIKMADDNNFVESTPLREKMWSVQTPQAFRYSLVKEAYDKLIKEEVSVTDDAMAVEAMLGYPIKLIMGDYKNIKVTTNEDLLIAKALLNS